MGRKDLLKQLVSLGSEELLEGIDYFADSTDMADFLLELGTEEELREHFGLEEGK